MQLDSFHPAIKAWFKQEFQTPTECQNKAWPAIQSGRHTLIAAPTGSGKTLAAFLTAIDRLVHQSIDHPLADETSVVYISPLKALSNDIHKNLEQPLHGIGENLVDMGFTDHGIRAFVRTGDTPTAVRNAMSRKPPHIIVTTPESFYILLTSDSGRRMLKTVKTAIVDEIHALVGSKRGSHLALSLERLEHLTEGRLTRIGLSATQRPLDEVGRYLVGDHEHRDACEIIDLGQKRKLDLDIVMPSSPLEALLSGQAASELYDKLANLINSHQTTLIFVNTRRMAERIARYLSERIGDENVTSHHGSLAREQRLNAETRLKSGQLKALVATASLELGIDIGDVDLVCQIGTTRSISALIQRVGRSGHHLGGMPKGRFFPTSRDELIECIALTDAIMRGELDRLCMPTKPKDVLAQQLVAMCACEDWQEDALYDCVLKAYPYQSLTKTEFLEVAQMLAQGFNTHRGQRGCYLHRDIINKTLKARRGARLTAITCGGAIPDNAEYRIVLEPSGEFIGTVDEDFAMETLAGDIFQLGNSSWRVLRLESGELKVEDAQNQPPTIPFWFGEAPGRTMELSSAVAILRENIAERCDKEASDNERAQNWLETGIGINAQAARQAIDYIATATITLDAIPSHNTLVLERFFDESGGMHLIIHSPSGSRINRAWGLALRKRFCRTFNFELQAAATEDAIILSLGTSQSFPLADVARYLNSKTVKDILIQAVLDAPMFTVRWRWNMCCALAVKRFQNGKKTPPYLVRMQADDLVATIFPEQMACAENLVGDREIPDHPLVEQTLRDCLTEAMDIDGLITILQRIESEQIQIVARDVVEPSPLAAQILNATNYAFLDGAPAEERRTRAVTSRRWLDPQEAADLGKLDPEAITRVQEEAWPLITNQDELCDALTTMGFMSPQTDASKQIKIFFDELTQKERAAEITLVDNTRGAPSPETKNITLWLSAERLPLFNSIYPGLSCDPQLDLPSELLHQRWESDAALTEIIRARLSVAGPVLAEDIADLLMLPTEKIEQVLLTLENQGYLFQGKFSPDLGAIEWCERGLLARIHRYTIKTLRKQIEPVSTADFMRFLFRWQRVHPQYQMEGAESLTALIEQLEGFETSAGAWEHYIFGNRIKGYDSQWLDRLCQSGKVIWARMSSSQAGSAPVRSSPITFLPRKHSPIWQSEVTICGTQEPTASAHHIIDILSQSGALFFDELLEKSGFLKTRLEGALAELVRKGFVNCDSFLGLRLMLLPEQKKHGRLKPLFDFEDVGRWTLIRKPDHQDGQHTTSMSVIESGDKTTDRREHIARVLLKRYGVVFRALLTRETLAPPWGDLLQIYRRMEARDEIRGGRFVSGQYGEQFALKEAIETMRKTRKQKDDLTEVVISACDPLNLLGVIMPGKKTTAHINNRIMFRNGVPFAVHVGKEIQFLTETKDTDKWDIKQKLTQTGGMSKRHHGVY